MSAEDETIPVPQVAQPRVTPGLVWRTLRHLRRDQIAGQLWTRLRRFGEWPAVLVPPEREPFPGCRWAGIIEVPPPGGRGQDGKSLRAGRFRFLNETRVLGFPPDWRARGASHLWRYNLHYFEWLWDVRYDDARAACLDWIERHPLGRGQVGWEPYPTSLRLQSWLPLFFGRHREALGGDPDLTKALWTSVVRQVRWLLRRLERHIAANHLMENAIALTMAGACFAGDEPRAWQQAGRVLLERQLAEQFLDDGLHYERTPTYHVRLLYALLVLAACEPEDWRDWLAPAIGPGLQALRQVVHPDGEVALFNDSAFGVQPAPAELLALARRLGFEVAAEGSGPAVISLPRAGYHGIRTSGGDALIVDAGAIGPDHQPGHGHADMLSFELSVQGRRVVVDSGVGSYQDRRWRAYSRATAAHSTVEIAGESQVELWGSFRVGRRVRPRGVEVSRDDHGFRLFAEHGGYEVLRGHPVHRRRFRFHPGAPAEDGERGGGTLTVFDEVTVGKAGRGIPAVARVIFAPGLELEPLAGGGDNLQAGPERWRLAFPDGSDEVPSIEVEWHVEGPRPGEVAVETVPVFPEFGVVRPASALVLRGELPLQATLTLSWT